MDSSGSKKKEADGKQVLFHNISLWDANEIKKLES
jgi:hypothetical protein